jgi:UDP-N-acetylmuramoyl-tripeptide--D-alanyl-D-alanine ligase
MMMRLTELAALLAAPLRGSDAVFDAVCTDTRSTRRGDLFIALRGERFDAHDFVAQAGAAGAVAAVVERPVASPIAQIVVANTLDALAALGRHWRAQFDIPLIALTGSNGKTTVKEMLASILRAQAGDDGVLATRGNLNNHIGVPLMLLELRERHRYAAIEMGMNHPGEIAQLAALGAPTVALVNNAQREHMEFMATVEAVAQENAAVFAALPAHGTAVVNADDAHADYFRRAAGAHRIVDFGIDKPAAVSGGYVLKNLTSEIRLRTPSGEAFATLAIPGLHNVRNALAACACAHAVGIAPEVMRNGLNRFRPYNGRLQVRHAAGGATVIDDTYNANPDSVRAAIDVLAECAPPTVLVLGDMGEVGDHAEAFHREVGAYARSCNVTSLCAFGEKTRGAAEAFGASATHAQSIEQLIERVRACATPQATLLVKGSRFMRMERVVSALTGETGGAH